MTLSSALSITDLRSMVGADGYLHARITVPTLLLGGSRKDGVGSDTKVLRNLISMKITGSPNGLDDISFSIVAPDQCSTCIQVRAAVRFESLAGTELPAEAVTLTGS